MLAKPKKNNRLDEYLNTPIKDVFENRLTKGTLLMISPFIASSFLPNHLSAQSCGLYTNGVVASSATNDSCPINYIDINNDGSNEIEIIKDVDGLNQRVKIRALYSTISDISVYFFTSGNSFALNLDYGNSIVDTSTGTYSAVVASNGTMAQFAIPDHGYVPFKVYDKIGFIEITIDENACVTVGSFGVQDTNDPNQTVQAGVCNSLLPVEFVSFDAEIKESEVELNWVTASEIGCVGYEVQRSMDGKEFSKIGFVDGQGNSDKEVSYVFQDKSTKLNDSYYYRLKQIDFDGGYEYTKVVSVIIMDKNSPVVSRIFPNPTRNSATLEISTPTHSLAVVELFDNYGRSVYHNSKNLFSGNNRIKLPIENLSNGIYFAKIAVDNHIMYERIVKQ